MHKYSSFFIACAVLSAGHLPLAAEPAAAVHQLSFKATLSSLKISARPGQVQTREFRLTLDPGQPTTRFKAHMQDWWRSEDGSQSFYAEPGTLTKSCGRWVTLNPVESDVAAGETLTTRLTVSVPGEARPGGYWCVLTVDELPDPLAATEGVGIKFMASVSVGVFIYVGEVQRAAELTAVDVRGNTAIVRIRNNGNTPLAIEGRFEFLVPGATQPTAVINLARGTLLTEPIATGLFSIQLSDASLLPSGRYLVRAIVDYGVDHYIGTEREIDIVRAGTALAKAH
ncbi:MAG: hypothetical protein WD690_08325 [Vicinamibacterales bacterium]